VGSFELQLYFYDEFLIMKGATASLRYCGRIVWTKHQSRIVFRQ